MNIETIRNEALSSDAEKSGYTDTDGVQMLLNIAKEKNVEL